VTTIAVRGRDCVVMATQRKVGDKLHDPDFVQHIFPVNKVVHVCLTGLEADARSLLARTRHEASDYAFNYGYDAPADVIATKMADLAQVYTQHAYMRPHGVSLVFFGHDAEKGPLLYSANPAGFVAGFKALAVGAKDQEAQVFLEKRIKRRAKALSDWQEAHPGTDADAADADIPEDALPPTREAALTLVLETFQSVLGSDPKGEALEVVIAEADGSFTRMDTEAIDALLTEVAERDL
jgi:20S proteasome subunit alpha 1